MVLRIIHHFGNYDACIVDFASVSNRRIIILRSPVRPTLVVRRLHDFAADILQRALSLRLKAAGRVGFEALVNYIHDFVGEKIVEYAIWGVSENKFNG